MLLPLLDTIAALTVRIIVHFIPGKVIVPSHTEHELDILRCILQLRVIAVLDSVPHAYQLRLWLL